MKEAIFKHFGYCGALKLFDYIHPKINEKSYQLLKIKILTANLSLDPQVA